MTETERRFHELLSCIAKASGQYNVIKQVTISSGGSLTFPKNTFHSLGFNLGSGASLQINNGDSTVTYTSNGSVQVTSLNETELILTAIGGNVATMWTTK